MVLLGLNLPGNPQNRIDNAAIAEKAAAYTQDETSVSMAAP